LGSNNIVDNIDNILDRVDTLSRDERFKSNFEGIAFDFWGGEPTLYPDVIEKVLTRFGDNAKYHMYTNGYTIDTMVGILEPHKENISIQVSYDGNPINDMRRCLPSGEPTSDKIIENLKLLVEKEFTINIKSTVTPPDFKYLPDAWRDIRELHNINPSISYGLTIDYSNDYDDFGEDLRRSMVEIARMERDFHLEKGVFLLSWFNSDKPKRCMLPSSGMLVDTNGDLYYCHGCLYEDTDALKFGHINDDNLLDKITHNKDFFQPPDEKEPCVSCFATTCMTCNVSKFINSKKDNFYDKWHDYSCDKRLCEYYKTISKVSIALKNTL
jgi:radical SAM protein with 4Fe4S-binding SPASM domain